MYRYEFQRRVIGSDKDVVETYDTFDKAREAFREIAKKFKVSDHYSVFRVMGYGIPKNEEYQCRILDALEPFTSSCKYTPAPIPRHANPERWLMSENID